MNSKIEHAAQTVNSSKRLLCCFDVSKNSLSLYAEYTSETSSGPDPCRIEENIPNQTGPIEQLLDRLDGLADKVALNGLLVLAEATGGYERKLLETAHRLAQKTGLISPEHVSKLKTVDPDGCRERERPTTRTRG